MKSPRVTLVNVTVYFRTTQIKLSMLITKAGRVIHSDHWQVGANILNFYAIGSKIMC